ncbi:MAG: hypothetical protein V7K21_20660, partial [Nostoc sp.]|uniref:hypothetical protein n=1 Tax=Nostoc sp. TaxID=1180 RepID=UPI002FF4B958
MTVLTCASTGKSITLLGEPKSSGEAKVWQTNRNGYLAKIYHSQTLEHVQKLAVMIAHRPKGNRSWGSQRLPEKIHIDGRVRGMDVLCLIYG